MAGLYRYEFFWIIVGDIGESLPCMRGEGHYLDIIIDARIIRLFAIRSLQRVCNRVFSTGPMQYIKIVLDMTKMQSYKIAVCISYVEDSF